MMNYSQEIVWTAALSGAGWEAANQVSSIPIKITLRAMSFSLAAVCIGFIMLQYFSLTRL